MEAGRVGTGAEDATRAGSYSPWRGGKGESSGRSHGALPRRSPLTSLAATPVLRSVARTRYVRTRADLYTPLRGRPDAP